MNRSKYNKYFENVSKIFNIKYEPIDREKEKKLKTHHKKVNKLEREIQNIINKIQKNIGYKITPKRKIPVSVTENRPKNVKRNVSTSTRPSFSVSTKPNVSVSTKPRVTSSVLLGQEKRGKKRPREINIYNKPPKTPERIYLPPSTLSSVATPYTTPPSIHTAPNVPAAPNAPASAPNASTAAPNSSTAAPNAPPSPIVAPPSPIVGPPSPIDASPSQIAYDTASSSAYVSANISKQKTIVIKHSKNIENVFAEYAAKSKIAPAAAPSAAASASSAPTSSAIDPRASNLSTPASSATASSAVASSAAAAANPINASQEEIRCITSYYNNRKNILDEILTFNQKLNDDIYLEFLQKFKDNRYYQKISIIMKTNPPNIKFMQDIYKIYTDIKNPNFPIYDTINKYCNNDIIKKYIKYVIKLKKNQLKQQQKGLTIPGIIIYDYIIPEILYYCNNNKINLIFATHLYQQYLSASSAASATSSPSAPSASSSPSAPSSSSAASATSSPSAASALPHRPRISLRNLAKLKPINEIARDDINYSINNLFTKSLDVDFPPILEILDNSVTTGGSLLKKKGGAKISYTTLLNEPIFWFDFDNTFISKSTGGTPNYNRNKNTFVNDIDFNIQMINFLRSRGLKIGILSRGIASSIQRFINKVNENQQDVTKKINIDYYVGSSNQEYIEFERDLFNEIKQQQIIRITNVSKSTPLNKQIRNFTSNSDYWAHIKLIVVLYSNIMGFLLDDTVFNIIELNKYINDYNFDQSKYMAIEFDRTAKEDFMKIISGSQPITNINSRTNIHRISIKNFYKILMKLPQSNAPPQSNDPPSRTNAPPPQLNAPSPQSNAPSPQSNASLL